MMSILDILDEAELAVQDVELALACDPLSDFEKHRKLAAGWLEGVEPELQFATVSERRAYGSLLDRLWVAREKHSLLESV